MMEKKFKFYVIVNWKNGRVKAVKRKPKKVSGYDIPILFDLTVKIPEPTEMKAKAEVIIPQKRLEEMVLEAL